LLNKLSAVLSLNAVAFLSLAGCSAGSAPDAQLNGGGIEGTGSGAFEIEISTVSDNPDFIDDPSLGCLANVYDKPIEISSTSELKPPAWMFGNWSGQRNEKSAITVIGTVDNVAFGTIEQSQQPTISDEFSERVVIELESSNQTYRFAVNDTVLSNPVSYVHEYSFIDSDQIRYSLSSDDYSNESIVLRLQNSSEIIRPPSWLLGEWRNEQCETRLFDMGNIRIEYDNGDPTISFAALLSGPENTFQTVFSDDAAYEIVATYLSPDGMQRLRFQERYELEEDGTVLHITAGRAQKLNRR